MRNTARPSAACSEASGGPERPSVNSYRVALPRRAPFEGLRPSRLDCSRLRKMTGRGPHDGFGPDRWTHSWGGPRGRRAKGRSGPLEESPRHDSVGTRPEPDPGPRTSGWPRRKLPRLRAVAGTVRVEAAVHRTVPRGAVPLGRFRSPAGSLRWGPFRDARRPRIRPSKGNAAGHLPSTSRRWKRSLRRRRARPPRTRVAPWACPRRPREPSGLGNGSRNRPPGSGLSPRIPASVASLKRRALGQTLNSATAVPSNERTERRGEENGHGRSRRRPRTL